MGPDADFTARRIPERFVVWIWESRCYRRDLTATDGRRVQVIYPGWRWGSWGPDFRAALLCIGDTVVRGDVEIHVHERDWARHGHATDPAYGGVVLHVVYEAPNGPEPRRMDGSAIPTVCLESQLEEPAQMLVRRWLASPHRPGPRPCLDPDEAAVVLEEAGLDRFRAKVARFEADLTCVDPGQALWAGVLETLGYARNTAAFRMLADRVPLAEARELARGRGALALQATLLGEAGLIVAQDGALPLDSYAREIVSAWRQGAGAPRDALPWIPAGGRPANSPARRVAAAASLVSAQPFWPSTREIMLALAASNGRLAATILRTTFTRAGDQYWQTHCDLGRPMRRPGAVLGSQRAAEAVVNAVLPWAAALARAWDRPDLERAAESCYRMHPPLASNHVTRHMAEQILGAAAATVPGSACRQQGLLHIYRTTCDARDCASCPAGQLDNGRTAQVVEMPVSSD